MLHFHFTKTDFLYYKNIQNVPDFNIHVDNAVDTDAIKLIDVLESYRLQQHVTSPTHKHDPTLDLIITRQSDQLLGNTPRFSRYISDHAAFLCSIRCDKPLLSVRKVSFRKLQSVNVVSLNEDLATSALKSCPLDPMPTTLPLAK